MNTIVKCECGSCIEVSDETIIGRRCIYCNEISSLNNFKGRRCTGCDKLKYKLWCYLNASKWKPDGEYYKYVKKSDNSDVK